ncbi:hypothetical protein PQX77_000596, partial [Marasmius sp. AFHP31]
LSILATAIQTLIAHGFFAHKILKSSNNNYFVTAPIIILAVARVVAATVTTSEMMKLQRFSAFDQTYPGWMITTGLSLSAGIDIIITCCLFYNLRTLRRQMHATGLVQVLDSLTLFTLENGLLTCIAAIASLVCWLTMPFNLIFLGLHFIIGKLYANSLLASLNTRKGLRQMGPRLSPWSDASLPVLSFDDFPAPVPPNPLTLLNPLDVPFNRSSFYGKPSRKSMPPLEVTVQQVVERTSEDRNSDDYLTALPRRAPTVLRWQQRPRQPSF